MLIEQPEAKQKTWKAHQEDVTLITGTLLVLKLIRAIDARTRPGVIVVLRARTSRRPFLGGSLKLKYLFQAIEVGLYGSLLP